MKKTKKYLHENISSLFRFFPFKILLTLDDLKLRSELLVSIFSLPKYLSRKRIAVIRPAENATNFFYYGTIQQQRNGKSHEKSFGCGCCYHVLIRCAPPTSAFSSSTRKEKKNTKKRKENRLLGGCKNVTRERRAFIPKRLLYFSPYSVKEFQNQSQTKLLLPAILDVLPLLRK